MWKNPTDSASELLWLRLRRAESLQWARAVPAETDFDSSDGVGQVLAMSSEIIFEVTEAEEGGDCATALGCGMTTQAKTLEALGNLMRAAAGCAVDHPQQAPKLVRLNFVSDEVLARCGPPANPDSQEHYLCPGPVP